MSLPDATEIRADALVVAVLSELYFPLKEEQHRTPIGSLRLLSSGPAGS